jgi:ferredoxin-type protein NapG
MTPSCPSNNDSNQKREETPSLSRRDFLRWLFPAGVMLGFGGSVYILTRDKAFLRPPGVLSEEQFLSLCIKCRKCEEICPQAVVEVVTLSEDIAGYGTPKLNFREGVCDFCMDCVEVCPTGALQMMDLEEIRLGVAEVIPESCIAWDWGGCTVCVDVCQYDAIHLDERERPVVDVEKCNGCGQCEFECPGAALRSFRSTSGRGIVVVPLGKS